MEASEPEFTSLQVESQDQTTKKMQKPLDNCFKSCNKGQDYVLPAFVSARDTGYKTDNKTNLVMECPSVN